MAREPGYCLHKPTGQAYVNLGGKVFYLGVHGSQESLTKYNSLKAEWLVNRHTPKFVPSGVTMAEVCLAFLEHAEAYYQQSDEAYQYELSIHPIHELYATLPAAQFGPIEFRTVRDWWLKREVVYRGKPKADKPKTKPKPSSKPARKCTRQHINKMMKRLIHVLKWSVGEGMLPPSVPEVLKCIAPLKRGRSEAPESKGITSVDQKLVDATLPHLTQVVADMVRFQQLTGCRPGEVCKITPSMVDRSGDVWVIELAKHKTAWRGKQRSIYVGPQAQAILKPYLLRAADAHCFSPAESERQRLDAKHEARVTPLSCGNRPGSKFTRKPRRRPGTSYTTGSYSRAITYACKRGKLQQWAPNQLRHSAATAIRAQFGIDAASVILGHSDLVVTQVYAEADKQKAIDITRRIG